MWKWGLLPINLFWSLSTRNTWLTVLYMCQRALPSYVDINNCCYSEIKCRALSFLRSTVTTWQQCMHVTSLNAVPWCSVRLHNFMTRCSDNTGPIFMDINYCLCLKLLNITTFRRLALSSGKVQNREKKYVLCRAHRTMLFFIITPSPLNRCVLFLCFIWRLRKSQPPKRRNILKF